MRSETDKSKTDDLIDQLPGESLVRQGLADLQSGRNTVSACLVSIARTRLQHAGLLRELVSFEQALDRRSDTLRAHRAKGTADVDMNCCAKMICG